MPELRQEIDQSGVANLAFTFSERRANAQDTNNSYQKLTKAQRINKKTDSV